MVNIILKRKPPQACSRPSTRFSIIARALLQRHLCKKRAPRQAGWLAGWLAGAGTDAAAGTGTVAGAGAALRKHTEPCENPHLTNVSCHSIRSESDRIGKVGDISGIFQTALVLLSDLQTEEKTLPCLTQTGESFSSVCTLEIFVDFEVLS